MMQRRLAVLALPAVLAVAAWFVPQRPMRYALGAAAVAVIVVWLVAVVPERQAAKWSSTLTAGERVELRDKARGTVVQMLGAIGLVSTAAITLFQIGATLDTTRRTLALTESSQAGERFGRAVEQLGAAGSDGKPVPEVRLGGISTLEQLARRTPDDRRVVTDILAAYIRTNAARSTLDPRSLPSVAPCQPDTSRVRVDVAAAVGALRRLYPVDGGHPWAAEPPRLDLSGAGLAGADLRHMDLRQATLSGAQIAFADLDGARLDDAELDGVDARSACFLLATAPRARFFTSAQFTRADLPRLPSTDLRGAALLGTDLTRADLSYADLRGATLDGVIIEGATLGGAKLAGAHLKQLRGHAGFPCGGPEDLSCAEVTPWQDR